MRRHSRMPLACIIVLSCVALLAIRVHWQSITPHIRDVETRMDTGERGPVALPLNVTHAATGMRISLVADLTQLHPRRWQMLYRGCLASVSVNGRPMLAAEKCEEYTGTTLDLGDLLRPGANTIAIDVRRGELAPNVHQFYLRVSPRDPLASLHIAAAACVLLLAFCAILAVLRPPRFIVALASIGMAGVLLRVLAVVATPFSVRGPDWQGHMAYVVTMAGRLRIPAPTEGWLTFHPPLWYWVSGLLYRVETLAGVGHLQAMGDLQVLSLMCSIATLALLITTGWLLFHKRMERPVLLLFAALCATVPEVVFGATRIGNDAPAQVCAAAVLCALVAWWRRPKARTWLVVGLAVAAGFLFKSTAIVPAAVAAACLALHPRLELAARLRSLGVLLACALPAAGWLPLVRLLRGENPSPLANFAALHPLVAFEPSVAHFVTFNPLRVLLHPFPNEIDGPGGRAFLETLWKSLHVGHGYGLELLPLAALLLAASGVALLLGVPRLIAALRRRDARAVPAIALLVSFVAVLSFSILSPYGSSQFARYVPLLLPAILVFQSEGTAGSRSTLRQALGWALACACALFPVLVFGLS